MQDLEIEGQPFGAKSSAIQLMFLGQEFLSWLYFHIHHISEIPLNDLSVHAKHGEMLRIGIGKQVALKPMQNQDSQVSVKGPMLDDSLEILQAIGNGLYISSLQLDFALPGRTYSLSLDAQGNYSQVKAKFDFKEKDQSFDDIEEITGQEVDTSKMETEEHIFLRMSALDEVEDIVDGLFGRFLKKRLGQSYVSQEIQAIRVIVAQSLVSRASKLSVSGNAAAVRENLPL